MKAHTHFILLPEELYGVKDKYTGYNTTPVSFTSITLMFLAYYGTSKANNVGYEIDKRVESILNTNWDVSDIYCPKKLEYTDISSKITTTPSQKNKVKYKVLDVHDVQPQNSTVVNVSDLLKAFNDGIFKNSGTLTVEGKRLALQLEEIILMLIKMDEISPEYYIYIPLDISNETSAGRNWIGVLTRYNQVVKRANGYLHEPEQTLIHPKELIHFSKRKVLNHENFLQLKSLLASGDEASKKIAHKIIDGCNISKSLLIVLLLINNLGINISRKKEKLLASLPNLRLWVQHPYNLQVDNIVEIYKKHVLRELTNEELEYIADNYYSAATEESSNFHFVLKPKKNKV
jgi:hypothetical protein